ncbi:MAG: DUF3536 domain-containing protein, partial [Thermodesulfobacteriota bacterium]
HYALSSLFEEYTQQTRLYCYAVQREDYHVFEAGKAKLLVGRAKMISEITLESADLAFGVLHFGDHNLNGGVKEFQGDEVYKATLHELSETFKKGDFPEIIRLIDKHFGESTYSIRSLFRDEQRKVLNLLLQSTLEEAEAVYRQLYERYAPMIRFMTNLGIPTPKAFYSAAEFVLNSNLRRAFENGELDPERIRTLLDEAKLERVTLDADTLEYTLRRSIERIANQLLINPSETSLLQRLNAILDITRSLPFMLNLWKAQNNYYEILQTVYPEFRDRAEKGDENARTWVGLFTSLGDKLSIRVQ